jgi:hypothetical protein
MAIIEYDTSRPKLKTAGSLDLTLNNETPVSTVYSENPKTVITA